MKRQEEFPVINPRLVPDVKAFGLVMLGAIIASGVIGISSWVVEMVQ